MSNLAAVTPDEEHSAGESPAENAPAVTGWTLPEMTTADARRLAVALLEQCEAEDPAPIGHGVMPYGWERITLVVPTLADAPVVDLVLDLRAEGHSRAAVAAELNARGLRTQSGGSWHAMAVSRLEKVWAGQKQRKRFTVPTVNRFL